MGEGILEEIDDVVELNGMPWIPMGESRRIPIANLTAKILCERHNSALSPLDKVGTQFFRAIKRYSVAAYDGKERISAFNGRDVERWMLKTFYGMLAARNFQIKHGEPICADIDMRCVELLYEKAPLSPTRGLFMRTDARQAVQTRRHISVMPVMSKIESAISGLTFSIMGFDFLMVTSPYTVDHAVHRPGYIVFSSLTGKKIIHLFWRDTEPHPVVCFISSN